MTTFINESQRSINSFHFLLQNNPKNKAERQLPSTHCVKFAVFVPLSFNGKTGIIDTIKNIIDADNCEVGNSEKSLQQKGIAYWKAKTGEIDTTSPIDSGEELRIITTVEIGRLERLIAKVRAAHPYEKMGYDLYDTSEYEAISADTSSDTPSQTTSKTIGRLKVSNLIKFIFNAPSERTAEIRNVMGNAGAGVIGNWSHCSFSQKISDSEEVIETVISQNLLDVVIGKIQTLFADKKIDYKLYRVLELPDTY